jgi:UDP-galactopyranose mutase
VPHAYPIYRIGYADELHRVQGVLAHWPTLHLAGRTGTFEYLNMDAVIQQAIHLADTLCRPA